jgi:hypothetical protein
MGSLKFAKKEEVKIVPKCKNQQFYMILAI